MLHMTTFTHNNTKQHRSELSLYSGAGERKYINAEERARFLKAAEQSAPHIQILCMLLTYSGCRLSEALALSPTSVQSGARILSVRSLKKRNKSVVREVPIPDILVDRLNQVFEQSLTQAHQTKEPNTFCPWKRTWAWVRIKRVMAKANIVGLQASPKGLRHGFGVHAVQSGVPLNLVQKWLGHSQISTTAIYANAVGPEEYAIAKQMWQ